MYSGFMEGNHRTNIAPAAAPTNTARQFRVSRGGKGS
jgi:hypothetical protein